MKKMFVGVIPFILLISCKTSKPITRLSGENSAWTLTHLSESKIQLTNPNKAPTFQFDVKENRIFGNGGCNGYSGEFRFSGDTLKVSGIIRTLIACDELDVENAFLSLLETDLFVYINDHVMYFKTPSGKNIAQFKK